MTSDAEASALLAKLSFSVQLSSPYNTLHPFLSIDERKASLYDQKTLYEDFVLCNDEHERAGSASKLLRQPKVGCSRSSRKANVEISLIPSRNARFARRLQQLKEIQGEEKSIPPNSIFVYVNATTCKATAEYPPLFETMTHHGESDEKENKNEIQIVPVMKPLGVIRQSDTSDHTDSCNISLLPSKDACFASKLKTLKESPSHAEFRDLPVKPIHLSSSTIISTVQEKESQEEAQNDSIRNDKVIIDDEFSFENVEDITEESGGRVKADHAPVQLPLGILLENIAPFIGLRTTWNCVSTLNKEIYALSKKLQRILYHPWPNVRLRVPAGRPWSIAIDLDCLCCGTDQGGLLIWKVYGGGSPISLQGKTSDGCGRINSVKCCVDWIVSGGDDKVTRVWNMETQSCEKILDGHTASVTCVAILKIDPDSSTASTTIQMLVATSSRDSSIRLHVMLLEKNHVVSSKLIMTISEAHRGPVHSIALYQRNDQCFLVSGGEDERLLKWSLGSTEALFMCTEVRVANDADCLFTYEGVVGSIAVSKDQVRIAAAFGRSVFVFWLGDETAELSDSGFKDWRVLKGHSNNIRSIDFSPCGKQIATACSDGSIRLWDLQRGTWIRKWIAHNGFMVCTLVFTLDGKSLVSAGSDGTVVIESLDHEHYR